MRRTANYFLVGIAVAGVGWSNVTRCMDLESQLPLAETLAESRRERRQAPSRWSRLGESLARFRCSEQMIERGLMRAGAVCSAVGTVSTCALLFGKPEAIPQVFNVAGTAMLLLAWKYVFDRAEANADRAADSALRADASAKRANQYADLAVENAERAKTFEFRAAKSASLVDAMCDGVPISLEDAQQPVEEPETVQSKKQRRDRRTKDLSSSDQQFFEEEESSLDEVPLKRGRKLPAAVSEHVV